MLHWFSLAVLCCTFIQLDQYTHTCYHDVVHSRTRSLNGVSEVWAGQELFSIAGQRVLITGGSGGIGRAMAVGFAERGATVVLLDVNKEQVSIQHTYSGPPASL